MFGWTYIDQSGEHLEGSPTFDDPETAEEWIGQSGPSLVELGVEQVELVDHRQGRSMYRMGLETE